MKINIAASILQNLSVFWYADFYWKLAHGGAPVSAYFDSFFLPDSKGFNKILRENRVVTYITNCFKYYDNWQQNRNLH